MQSNAAQQSMVDPSIHAQRIFYNDTKATEWKKESIFNMWCYIEIISLWGKMTIVLISEHI